MSTRPFLVSTWKRRCLALEACHCSGVEWALCAMEFTRVALCEGGFVTKQENFIDVTAVELSCGEAGRQGSSFEPATICSAVSSVAFISFLVVRDSSASNCVVPGLNGF